MAGYYKVELEGLAQLITRLGECADDMRAAMKQLKDIGPKGSGYAELEEACDDFQDKWGYGIGLIADATGGVTEGLAESRKVYEALEDQIAESFKASASGTDGGK
ncbi:hypothetical protein [Streptomyces sp. AS02]|uniref:hypothetical protein n=1 Tax=Streptomyces sp. AS02 TaxID=2938946 RepID=UPI0020208DCB|nr:hypothetical protein [Streptomyces sp. AS02]MCL8016814.1 hypothetical protein [Streptomyces sp. AS02]